MSLPPCPALLLVVLLLLRGTELLFLRIASATISQTQVCDM
jgi:hypothetical protein